MMCTHPGTYENGPNEPGRYRSYLVHNWDTKQLSAGDHDLEVAVSDTGGNTATESLPFSVIDWLPVPTLLRLRIGMSQMAAFPRRRQ
jgi:hypothetical protein